MKGDAEGRMSAKTAKRAAQILERFGLGRLGYTAKPQKVEILLDGAKAKKEFVDISISFLNGMIGGILRLAEAAGCLRGRKGSYRITMKQ
jgi:mRNA-degrading endonuclease RelE of RelBE toxin-antitoxin system